jgi:hypothetical protein
MDEKLIGNLDDLFVGQVHKKLPRCVKRRKVTVWIFYSPANKFGATLRFKYPSKPIKVIRAKSLTLLIIEIFNFLESIYGKKDS